MKFVTYVGEKKSEKLGLLTHDGQVIDALAAYDWIRTLPNSPVSTTSQSLPTDILTVMRNEATMMPVLKQIIQAHNEGRLPSTLLKRESELTLLSPVPHPTSMRDGYAFRQHVEAARRNRGVPMIDEFDDFPIYYYTNHLAVTGPGPVAVQKKAQDKLDFELEVAVVIGKPGRNIPASKADEHIFGYMIMNDWSARTLQMEEMKLNLGPAKGKDFATSLGPYLLTRDELASVATTGPNGERHNLKMKAFVNGKQLSEGNLKDISWTFAQIIERVSYGVTLQAGEVIGSGTVGTGCLLELNGSKITDNLWIQVGDEVVLEVEKLGRLVNRIEDAPESPA